MIGGHDFRTVTDHAVSMNSNCCAFGIMMVCVVHCRRIENCVCYSSYTSDMQMIGLAG